MYSVINISFLWIYLEVGILLVVGLGSQPEVVDQGSRPEVVDQGSRPEVVDQGSRPEVAGSDSQLEVVGPDSQLEVVGPDSQLEVAAQDNWLEAVDHNQQGAALDTQQGVVVVHSPQLGQGPGQVDHNRDMTCLQEKMTHLLLALNKSMVTWISSQLKIRRPQFNFKLELKLVLQYIMYI